MNLRSLPLLAVCLLAFSANAETNLVPLKSWPQYRGPAGDGQALQSNLPTVIDESVVTWQTPIHGKGWSSPVVWDDKIWLTTATQDGKKMSVLCVDAKDGKVLIDKVLCENAEPQFCHPMNSYATPTPVLEDGRVYVHFGSYLTACLDAATTEMIWERRDLQCDHYRGPASSPIVHDGKLFVAFDGFDLQYVAALDKNTGKTVWKTDRDIDYGTDNGDRMKAYCTGHIIHVDGVEQLVYPSAVATIAYAPKTGDPIWTVYHKGMNASARPVFHDGMVFLTNGMGTMVAVAANGKGDVTDTHIAWSAKKGVAKKSSQLIVDDLMYMVSDDGVATCRDPRLAICIGKSVWKGRTLHLPFSLAERSIYSAPRATSQRCSPGANSSRWPRRNWAMVSWHRLQSWAIG